MTYAQHCTHFTAGESSLVMPLSCPVELCSMDMDVSIAPKLMPDSSHWVRPSSHVSVIKWLSDCCAMYCYTVYLVLCIHLRGRV